MKNHIYPNTFSHIILTIVSYRECWHYRCFGPDVAATAVADDGIGAAFGIWMLPL